MTLGPAGVGVAGSWEHHLSCCPRCKGQGQPRLGPQILQCPPAPGPPPPNSHAAWPTKSWSLKALVLTV